MPIEGHLLNCECSGCARNPEPRGDNEPPEPPRVRAAPVPNDRLPPAMARAHARAIYAAHGQVAPAGYDEPAQATEPAPPPLLSPDERRARLLAAQDRAVAVRGDGRVPRSEQRCAVCTHERALHDGEMGACHAGESAGARCACASFNGVDLRELGHFVAAAAPPPDDAPFASLFPIPVQPRTDAPTPWDEDDDALPAAAIEHVFPLRANHRVPIALPIDLTDHEVYRLTSWLRGLVI